MGKCETCMEQLTTETRQLMGCPLAPAPPPRAAGLVKPWQGLGYAGPSPAVCPGYTVQLPEVIETARARLHWRMGELRSFCGGAAPGALLERIEILEGAARELEEWRLTPATKGGGAEG